MILGLDPGTKTGAAWLEDGRVQVETWKIAGPDRWLTLFDMLARAGPRLIVAEDARQSSFQAKRGNAARIFQASFHAIVELYASQSRCSVETVPPATLKKYATGSGRSDKAAMIAAAEKHLGLLAPTDNEADAAWLLRRGLEIRRGLAPMAAVRAGRAVALGELADARA